MGRDLVTEILFTNEKVHFIKNVIALVVVFKAVGNCLQQLYNRGFVGLAKEWKVYLIARTFRLLKKLPFVQARIKKETGEIFEKMEKDVAPKKEGEPRFLELPSEGFKPEEVNKLLQTYDGMAHMDVMSGMASGTVYHGMPELTAVVHEAYKKFSFSNPLHPDVFPGVRKMEAEVVAMVVKMFNGGPTACGTTTSGGTESILMACKAMRDWALDVKGITEPEMVVPVSAHAAFDKAAHYFGIKIIHAPVDDVTRKVDVRAVRRMVTSNTIMIVGSAPGFPHGVIDDIESLAKIAKRWNIGLHVDSCLGGFLVPFMEEAGFPLPLFDFRVDGVTSISCDTHKYGFAPKGSSVVLYSKPEYRHHQYFVAPDWPGGIYASPTIAGSRPGALIAACWAAMMFMGRKGYVESARRIVQTARNIVAGLKKVPGLKVFGEPLVSVVAFGSDEFDIYLLGEKLTKEGWNLNSLQYPPSIHICCTQLTPKVEKKFIDDVTRFAAEIMAGPRDAKTGGMAAIYGMAASLPDRSLVDYMARGFIDCLYSA